MTRIVVYIHPTCKTSYNVVKYLAERGLLDRVRLVSTSLVGPVDALGNRVWSVPWILVNGAPAATDPVEGEEVEAIITGGSIPRRDPLEAFMETVLHSAYAAALAYVHGGLDPVLDPALASAAVRAPLTGEDARKVLEEVREQAESLYSSWEDRFMRALAVSYVRELWWATQGRLDRDLLLSAAKPHLVAQWLLAKASMGRNGLPDKPSIDPGRVERMVSFLEKGAQGLVNRVRREQEQIMGDHDYWELLGKKLEHRLG